MRRTCRLFSVLCPAQETGLKAASGVLRFGGRGVRRRLISFCPALKLTNSCHSDAPDGLSVRGQMAKTDFYVLIRYHLEPSPNAEVASNYTHVPNRLKVRSSEECWAEAQKSPCWIWSA